MIRAALRASLLSAAVALAACDANDPVYVKPAESPVELGVGPDAPAAATVTVDLRFRPPTQDESNSLRDEGRLRRYRVPWLRSDKVALSVLYTVTNLGDEEGTAQIEVNGASELASYDPAALLAAALAAGADEDDVEYLSLVRPKPLRVPAGASVSGTIREDDFKEAAIDLDAIGRWMAAPEAVLLNRSESSRLGLERVPADVITPAFFRVQLGLAASVPMRFEFLVRVRDEERRVMEGPGAPFAPMPMSYTPPAAPMGM